MTTIDNITAPANPVGHINLLTTSFLQVVKDGFSSWLPLFKDISLNFGTKDSGSLMEGILADDTVPLASKAAYALLCSLGSNAQRFKEGWKNMRTSNLKQALEPVINKLGQKGMQNLYTPAHFQNAFPGIALLGRCALIASKDKKMFFMGGELDMMIMKQLYFPGFGGLCLSKDLQAIHESLDQEHYNSVVVGTKWEARWYELRKRDNHPAVYMTKNGKVAQFSQNEELTPLRLKMIYNSVHHNLHKDDSLKYDGVFEDITIGTTGVTEAQALTAEFEVKRATFLKKLDGWGLTDLDKAEIPTFFNIDKGDRPQFQKLVSDYGTESKITDQSLILVEINKMALKGKELMLKITTEIKKMRVDKVPGQSTASAYTPSSTPMTSTATASLSSTTTS